jgi:hypothetical protein
MNSLSWGDCAIYSVHRDTRRKYIWDVRACPVVNGRFGNERQISSPALINEILSGKKFVTTYKGPDEQYHLGEDVCVVKVNGEYYLRTDPNEITEDNLGELPEY